MLTRRRWLQAAVSAFLLFTVVAPAVAERGANFNAPPNFVPLVKATLPSVVNIASARTIRLRDDQLPDDPFLRQLPRERRISGLGSGVIVSGDGYILTNRHVIANMEEIKVTLSDKREFKGRIIGTDPRTDLAVIKIDARGLPTIPWGDSDRLEVGEYVLAIGNPYGLSQTVTQGIVSALGRNLGITDYEGFIQTDAAINPGNSGGALVNVRGELVGINVAIIGSSGGIGLAIPSNGARTVMTSLIQKGRVVRGFLGVQIRDITPALAKTLRLEDARGALVGEVVPDSPAARGGLQPGDVILHFNGKRIENSYNLRATVAATDVGRQVKVEVWRGGKSQTVEIKVAELPSEPVSARGGDGVTVEGTVLSGLGVRALNPGDAKKLELPANTRGLLVTGVAGDSPARQAGVRAGDVIVRINHLPVGSVADFRRLNERLSRHDAVMLHVIREGRLGVVILEP
jgi:serine protease Do